MPQVIISSDDDSDSGTVVESCSETHRAFADYEEYNKAFHAIFGYGLSEDEFTQLILEGVKLASNPDFVARVRATADAVLFSRRAKRVRDACLSHA